VPDYKLKIKPESAQALRDALETAEILHQAGECPKSVVTNLQSLVTRVKRAEMHHDIYYSPITKAYEIQIQKPEYEAALWAQQAADKMLGTGSVQFGPTKVV